MPNTSSGSSSFKSFIPFGSPLPSNAKKDEKWDVVFLGNPYGGKGRRIPILESLGAEFNVCPVMEAWGENLEQKIEKKVEELKPDDIENYLIPLCLEELSLHHGLVHQHHHLKIQIHQSL